ncbi:hypothetical protein A6723_006670 [Pseudomonas sp. AU11447]|uniref:hypothetical protein n=1 Tax=Pseudomonas sp. AU11447 TaxID=1843184 RepID=UPI000806D270|nr:hypothetical protein [Pseudomonas sp. AU11447]OBY87560.1 hypothetical protein A6723_006670 [Pseudomonas sp. AU11447]
MAMEVIGWAVTLLGAFAGIVVALVKLLLWQFEKRLSEKFAAQDEARREASKHWEDNFAKVLERQDKGEEAVQQLERAFLNFKADLPFKYVGREDWARGHSIIEAKLDGLALRYENILLKGARND